MNDNLDTFIFHRNITKGKWNDKTCLLTRLYFGTEYKYEYYGLQYYCITAHNRYFKYAFQSNNNLFSYLKNNQDPAKCKSGFLKNLVNS